LLDVAHFAFLTTHVLELAIEWLVLMWPSPFPSPCNSHKQSYVKQCDI